MKHDELLCVCVCFSLNGKQRTRDKLLIDSDSITLRYCWREENRKRGTVFSLLRQNKPIEISGRTKDENYNHSNGNKNHLDKNRRIIEKKKRRKKTLENRDDVSSNNVLVVDDFVIFVLFFAFSSSSSSSPPSRLLRFCFFCNKTRLTNT